MYNVQRFDHLLGTPGFSNNALKTHFKLYEGYVTNVNKLKELLEKAEPGTSHFAELKRRFGWEFNGMRLHEIYFSSFGNKETKLDEQSELSKKIIDQFGSIEAWQEDFKATAMMRGIGWAILYYEQSADRLFNVWVNEHDAGHLGGAKILLPLDVFEHAFMLDYGTDRISYVDAFLQAVNWDVVKDRITKTQDNL